MCLSACELVRACATKGGNNGRTDGDGFVRVCISLSRSEARREGKERHLVSVVNEKGKQTNYKTPRQLVCALTPLRLGPLTQSPLQKQTLSLSLLDSDKAKKVGSVPQSPVSVHREWETETHSDIEEAEETPGRR